MTHYTHPNYNAAEVYADMKLFFRCWACGRTSRDQPPNWYAPWLIERAHVVSKPRVEDRRCVVMLCSLCHKLSHGERFSGVEQPKLARPHLLWIKQRVDPSWYDVGQLAKCVVGVLPEPEEPPKWYVESQVLRGWKPWQKVDA